MTMRNPTLDIGGLKVKFIGDPHLGRRFASGVPTHRLGEREQMVRNDFTSHLFDNGPDVKMVVVAGDIFDGFIVPFEAVVMAYNTLTNAAVGQPDVDFIVLRGNHDQSRDVTKASAFDVLELLVIERGLPNLHIVRQPRVIKEIGFAPFDAFQTAADVVEFFSEMPGVRKLKAVVGHWDLDDFGDGNPNLIPAMALKKVTDLAITGHVHQPHRRKIEGLQVIVTGSMQPYAHGEDGPEEADPLYVTTTVKEILSRPKLFNDKCVRIRLEEGEDKVELPEEFSPLQLNWVPARQVDSEQEEQTVELGDFNFKQLFYDTLTERGLTADQVLMVWNDYQQESEKASC